MTSQVFSANFKLTDYDLGINNLYSASKLNNKLVVLGGKNSYSGFFRPSALRIFENGRWDSLPPAMILNDTNKEVLTTLMSQVHYDSTGTIWVGSDMMYAYKNGKWSAFFIDDSLKQLRHYNMFCVDIYNNLWITTSIFDQKRTDEGYQGYSELLKFDGKTFEKIVSTNSSSSFTIVSMTGVMPNSIAALSDGRIVLHRFWNEKDIDDDKENHNLIFYNQDGTYNRLKIPSLSGEQFDRAPKDITSIFEDGNKIWFSLNIFSWWFQESNGKWMSGACCSGLLSFKNGNEWEIFDENNGLTVKRDSLRPTYAERVYKFIKLNRYNYLVFGQKSIYTMGEDNVLKSLSLKEIGDNSTIIKANQYGTMEEFKIRCRFDDTNAQFGNYLPDIMDLLTFNNEIWVITQSGIIVFPESLALLGVDDENQNEMSEIVYPNPAHNSLRVNNQIQYDEYIIYNQLGESLLIGSVESAQFNIDVSRLNAGMYLLCLRNKQNQKVLGFIKN